MTLAGAAGLSRAGEWEQPSGRRSRGGDWARGGAAPPVNGHGLGGAGGRDEQGMLGEWGSGAEMSPSAAGGQGQCSGA